jgi:hypothetical protein
MLKWAASVRSPKESDRLDFPAYLGLPLQFATSGSSSDLRREGGRPSSPKIAL